MGNQALSKMDFSLPDVAPKTIDEIGDRTFRVKERLWAFNTLANLPYIWCKNPDHWGYPPYLEEVKQLRMRLEVLERNKKDNKHENNAEQTDKDIESIKKQLEELIPKQCPDCLDKQEFRIDKFHDKESGDCLVIGAGPSVIDSNVDTPEKTGVLIEKAEKAIKRYNGTIITVDRSLIPLLKAGIIPKFVVVADGADHVEQYFKHELVEKAIKEHGIIGIFNTQTHPKVTKRWVGYGGKIMWYNVALDELHKTKSLTRYLFHLTNDSVASIPWGNVSAYGFGLGYLIGYNPVILYGVDLGFGEQDDITSTPYWNPYFKATIREFIFKKIGVRIGEPLKPEQQEKYIKVAKEMGYDDNHEYTAKDKEFYEKHKVIYDETIKRHFHYYTNPFGNKVYHDNIFKAYKDIMFSFFFNNPRAKIIQASEYTTMFAIPCDHCNGKKVVNQIVQKKKQCFKCKQEAIINELGKQVPCPQCLRDIDKLNDKGEPVFESTGIKGNNITCQSLDDYINSKLVI